MSAQDDFIAGPHRKDFEAVSQTAAFRDACRYALLQFIEEQPLFPTNPSTSWDGHSQLCGARKVIEILKTLHLKQEMPKPDQGPTIYRPRTK